MDLKNKVLLLTGASTGIGKAIAGEFLKKRARVIVFGRHKPRVCSEFFEVDVGREDEIVSAMSGIKKIDILINNAGVDKNAPISETSNEILDEMLDINFKGLFWMTKHAIPKLRRGSCIVNIGSLAGLTAIAGSGIYCATKAAVISLTRTLALELAGLRIRVNCIAPGVVDTSLWDKRYGAGKKKVLKEIADGYIPLRRAGRPEEIASAAVFICENDYVDGATIVVDGGQNLM